MADESSTTTDPRDAEIAQLREQNGRMRDMLEALIRGNRQSFSIHQKILQVLGKETNHAE